MMFACLLGELLIPQFHFYTNIRYSGNNLLAHIMSYAERYRIVSVESDCRQLTLVLKKTKSFV